MSKQKNTSDKQENVNDFSGYVGISSFIDQGKAKLIGYQAFYKDGSNKFYENFSEIENNIVSNPLVDVKQVGTSY